MEEELIQRSVKTTIQILYDTGLFASFPNADRILKDALFVKRIIPDLKEVNKVNQRFYSYKLLEN